MIQMMIRFQNYKTYDSREFRKNLPTNKRWFKKETKEAINDKYLALLKAKENSSKIKILLIQMIFL